LIKKKNLSILLSQLAVHKKPKLRWEGYTLDSESTASIIYVAARVNDDITGKKVVDLGCGSGGLAIGASLLGASSVIGIDIDKEAIMVAKENLQRMNVEVDFIIGDISCITGHFDTVIMNPPFGSWNKGSDIKFVMKALEITDIIYTLIKSNNSVREYMKQKIPKMRGKIEKVYAMDIFIPKTYSFHKKKWYPVKADLYKIVKNQEDIQ
jgi:putative methylase